MLIRPERIYNTISAMGFLAMFWQCLECLDFYSSVPNRRACTFIDFEKKNSPARPYFALHVYCF